jgi:hypothetical protein
MRRIVFCLTVILVLCAAGAAETETKRILIVSDSWGMQLTSENYDGFPSHDVFENVLAANGFPDVGVQGAKTARGGRSSAFWAKAENLAVIVSELNEYPTIDIVHLITGGIDFLDALLKEDFTLKTDAERDAVWEGVKANIRTIVNTCLGVRDTIRVVLADYDYVDHERMERPPINFDFHGVTVLQFNTWFVDLGRKKLEVARNTPRCEYVQNWGTLQYWFGDPPRSVPYPGAAPDYDPYPGGDIASPWPANVAPDGVHPTDEAHAKMLQNAMDQYYRAWLTAEAESAAARSWTSAILILGGAFFIGVTTITKWRLKPKSRPESA